MCVKAFNSTHQWWFHATESFNEDSILKCAAQLNYNNGFCTFSSQSNVCVMNSLLISLTKTGYNEGIKNEHEFCNNEVPCFLPFCVEWEQSEYGS